jgi:hypothetical protein
MWLQPCVCVRVRVCGGGMRSECTVHYTTHWTIHYTLHYTTHHRPVTSFFWIGAVHLGHGRVFSFIQYAVAMADAPPPPPFASTPSTARASAASACHLAHDSHEQGSWGSELHTHTHTHTSHINVYMHAYTHTHTHTHTHTPTCTRSRRSVRCRSLRSACTVQCLRSCPGLCGQGPARSRALGTTACARRINTHIHTP